MKAPRSKPKSSDSSSSAGKRRAVHLDERSALPRRGVVDGARHELLAGSALAADQHGDIGIGHPLDQLVNLPHLFARWSSAPPEVDAARSCRGTESELGMWSIARNSRVIQLAPPSLTSAAE